MYGYLFSHVQQKLKRMQNKILMIDINEIIVVCFKFLNLLLF